MPTSLFAAGQKDYIARLNELANATFGIAAIQTVNFTAAKGWIYPLGVNALSITLPLSPITGDRIAFIGKNSTIKSLTFLRNGNNIESAAADYPVTVSQFIDIVLEYVDATVGWKLNAVATLDSYLALVAAGVPRRNMIPAGDFGTNPWQRGTTFTGVVNGQYHADRFFTGKSTTGVFDVSQSSASVPTVAQAGKLITNCLLVNVTTADAAVAAGDFATISTRVVGSDWQHGAQKATHIRFWHAHTKTGTHCIALSNSVPDRSLVMEYTQSVADAWEEAILELPASPSAGTWVYDDTGVGINVHFTMMAGSTFQNPAGAWATGNFLGSSNQVNNLDTIGNKFRLADIRFGSGTSANATFERIDKQAVLDHCRWYYRRWVSNAGNHCWLAAGEAASATVVMILFNLGANMRKNPTLNFSAIADMFVFYGGANTVLTGLTEAFFTEAPLLTATVAGGLTAGNIAVLFLQAGTGKFVDLSSDLL